MNSHKFKEGQAVVLTTLDHPYVEEVLKSSRIGVKIGTVCTVTCTRETRIHGDIRTAVLVVSGSNYLIPEDCFQDAEEWLIGKTLVTPSGAAYSIKGDNGSQFIADRFESNDRCRKFSASRTRGKKVIINKLLEGTWKVEQTKEKPAVGSPDSYPKGSEITVKSTRLKISVLGIHENKLLGDKCILQNGSGSPYEVCVNEVASRISSGEWAYNQKIKQTKEVSKTMSERVKPVVQIEVPNTPFAVTTVKTIYGVDITTKTQQELYVALKRAKKSVEDLEELYTIAKSKQVFKDLESAKTGVLAIVEYIESLD